MINSLSLIERNSVNVHSHNYHLALQIWCLSKVRTRPAGRIGDFGYFLIVFTKSP